MLATDLTLTKAQCQKLAGIGHDGLARAIDPVHTMFDGDTRVRASRPATRPAPGLPGCTALLVAAGDCFTRAVVHGVLAAAASRPRPASSARTPTRSPPPSGPLAVG